MKKFPLKNHVGTFLKGFGEIADDSLSVHISFSAFVPATEQDIDEYRKYVENLGSFHSIEFGLSALLHVLKIKGYKLEDVFWKRDTLHAFRQSQSVAENVGIVLEFSFNPYSGDSHKEVVMEILKAFDSYLNNLQQTEEYRIIFVPQDMISIRSERKVKMFKALSEAQKIGTKIG